MRKGVANEMEKVSLGLCVCGFKCMWSVTVVAFRIANSADGNWLVNHRNVVFDRCVARWRDSLRHKRELTQVLSMPREVGEQDLERYRASVHK